MRDFYPFCPQLPCRFLTTPISSSRLPRYKIQSDTPYLLVVQSLSPNDGALDRKLQYGGHATGYKKEVYCVRLVVELSVAVLKMNMYIVTKNTKWTAYVSQEARLDQKMQIFFIKPEVVESLTPLVTTAKFQNHSYALELWRLTLSCIDWHWKRKVTATYPETLTIYR